MTSPANDTRPLLPITFAVVAIRAELRDRVRGWEGRVERLLVEIEGHAQNYRATAQGETASGLQSNVRS